MRKLSEIRKDLNEINECVFNELVKTAKFLHEVDNVNEENFGHLMKKRDFLKKIVDELTRIEGKLEKIEKAVKSRVKKFSFYANFLSRKEGMIYANKL